MWIKSNFNENRNFKITMQIECKQDDDTMVGCQIECKQDDDTMVGCQIQ
jgi:hypothetical protein